MTLIQGCGVVGAVLGCWLGMRFLLWHLARSARQGGGVGDTASLDRQATWWGVP